ncbi:MAG: hypothetical protein ACRD0Y_07175, partial [Terriglobales bacterium]
GGPGFQDGGGLNDELYPLALASDGGQNLFFTGKSGEALRQYNFGSGSVQTLIGDGPYTFTIGEGDGIAYDAANQTVYVADDQEADVIGYGLTSREKTVLAGVAGTRGDKDGTGAAALFNGPRGLAISPDDKTLYVADSANNAIRKIDIATGAVTTIGGEVCQPNALALDSTGANLYIVNPCSGDDKIEQMVLATGVLTDVATGFSSPTGLAIDPHTGANILYVVDGNQIDAVVLGGKTPVIYTVAGSHANGYANGSGSAAAFYQPQGLTALAGPSGSTQLFLADSLNGVLRQINISNPLTATSSSNVVATVVTLAGQPTQRGRADGPGTGPDYSSTSTAQFDQPEGMVTDGKVAYIADSNNGAIRKIDLASGDVSTVAGPGLGYADGPASSAAFYENAGLAWYDANGQNVIYIADSGNNLIRKLDLNAKTVTTVAGSRTCGSPHYQDGAAAQACFNHPFGILVSPDGTTLYVAEAGNQDIRMIDLTTNIVSTIAGSYNHRGEKDGPGAAAEFSEPNGMAWSPDYKNIYISDFEGNAIRELNLATDTVTTIVGMSHICGNTDGPVDVAKACDPTFIATDGYSLFWAEADVGQIRVMDLATSVVYTLGGLAGQSTGSNEVVLHQANGALTEVPGELTGPVRYNNPFGIALDPSGNFILISNKNENTIRIVH